MEIIECNGGGFVLVQVKKNESLNDILLRFSAQPNSIVRNNPNIDVYEGEMIKIMNKYKSFHIVKPMETLFTIAQKYNTTVDELIKQNELSSSRLFIGQTLVVDNKSKQA